MPDLSKEILDSDLDRINKARLCAAFGVHMTVGDVLAKSPLALTEQHVLTPSSATRLIGWLVLNGYDIKGEWWLHGQMLLQSPKVRCRIGTIQRTRRLTPAQQAYCEAYGFDYLNDQSARASQINAAKLARSRAKRAAARG